MMDAFATYMWVSAYMFQLVLLASVIWGVIAIRKRERSRRKRERSRVKWAEAIEKARQP